MGDSHVFLVLLDAVDNRMFLVVPLVERGRQHDGSGPLCASERVCVSEWVKVCVFVSSCLGLVLR